MGPPRPALAGRWYSVLQMRKLRLEEISDHTTKHTNLAPDLWAQHPHLLLFLFAHILPIAVTRDGRAEVQSLLYQLHSIFLIKSIIIINSVLLFIRHSISLFY